MLNASTCSHFPNITHCFNFFLVIATLFPSRITPQSFSIIKTDDEGSGNSMGLHEDNAWSTANASKELNTLNFLRVGRAIYGQPLLVNDSSPHFSLTNGPFDDSIFVFYSSNDTGFKPWFGPPESDAKSRHRDRHRLHRRDYINVEYDDFDPTMQRVAVNDSIIHVSFAGSDTDLKTGKQAPALIAYNASTKTLLLSWSFDANSTALMPNASLSYQISLSEILPGWGTVGFSAATSLSPKGHIIQSCEFSLNSTDPKVNNKNESRNRVVKLVAFTCSVTSVLVLVSICWLIIKNRIIKADDKDNLGRTLVDFDLDREAIPRRFDYKEIAAATNGFADDRRLARGGSAQVYRGVLRDSGCEVAVKRISTHFENSMRIFISEVKIMRRLIHRNVVQFTGWCHEQGEFLLIFEYMPNGSLDAHLFGNGVTLAWDVRHKIALGVITALHYLHQDAEQCVLHRDIKSANVLLDSNFSAKLGDFGMAKLEDPKLSSTQRKRVVGTYGYLAPEYISEGRASKESDMYSFGVVALEIACGRRTYQDGEYHVPLMNWVWQLYLEGNIINAADERLNGDFDINEVTCLLIVGLWCTHPDNKKRPNAAEVIKVLKLEAPLPILPHDMRDHPPCPIHGLCIYSFQSQPITSSLVDIGR